MTHLEVGDIRIGKQIDKTSKKQIEVAGRPGGVEIVVSTKKTGQAKTTVKGKLKIPLLDVDFGAKINWLVPRTHNKSRVEQQPSDSHDAG